MSFWRKRRRINLQVVEVVVCARCEDQGALISCVDCNSAFCYDCCEELHSKGGWRTHNLIPLKFPILSPIPALSDSDQAFFSTMVQNPDVDMEENTAEYNSLVEDTKELEISDNNSQMETEEKKTSTSPTRMKRKSILDAMKEGKLILFVDIENYQELNCAKTVTEFFEPNDSVRSALQHVASRNSVGIDLSGGKEDYFDLYYINTKGESILMPKDAVMKTFPLNYKQTIFLKRAQKPSGKREGENNQPSGRALKRMMSLDDALREGKIILYVDILDYEILNCVKRVSGFFDPTESIFDVLKQVAGKNSVGISLENGRDNFFQLFHTSSKGETARLEKSKQIKESGIRHKDILQLKMMDT